MAEPTYDSILIAGEPYRLSAGVKVVTHEDRGGLSFERRRNEVLARYGSPGYGKRYHDGKPVQSVRDLRQVVTQAILHTDMTRDSAQCFAVLVDRGLSTHFMIDWDGTIYQALDPIYDAFHAGSANPRSVGIDLNNRMRNLVREPDAPAFDQDHPRAADMSKPEFKRPISQTKRINLGRVRSYGYTDAQYHSLLALLKVLMKELDGIKPFCPFDEKREIIADVLEDAAGFQGFLGHWHVTPDRWDPGPGFDWQRVAAGLAREHNAFPIELVEGKNIASLLEPTKVKAYAEDYYRNNEEVDDGGWFPMGMQQNWHGGIHLHAPAGTPVYAMFDGMLVAGRFGPRPSPMGHNNFLVIRHEVPMPAPKDREPETLVFFTLTMHLGALDVGDVGPGAPEWVKGLHRIHSGLTEEEEQALGALPTEEDAAADPAAADGADEEEDLELDGDVDLEAPAYLTLGQHLAGFKRGEIALVDWQKNPVKISSGERIGSVGSFGPPDEWEDLVHVEVFAEDTWRKAVDQGVHGRYLVEVEGDFGDDLFVEDPAILDLFERSSSMTQRGSLVPQRILPPGLIEDFFTTPDESVEERRWLRKVVSRHVSEWSDSVDWVSTLSKAEDWDGRTADFKRILRQGGVFRDAIRSVLPFVWLTREVAQHMGLDVKSWDGVVDHFHPIHFLMWLTYHSSQRIQVLSRGQSLAQIKRELARVRKEAKKRDQADQAPCIHAAIDVQDVESTSAGEVLESWLQGHDQGDWRRPEEPEP